MRLPLALRALLTLAVGFFITFNQSHSAQSGLLALAIFGITFAILVSVSSAIWNRGVAAIESIPLATAALIVGILAALVPQGDQAAQSAAFIYLVTGWGLIAGSFELYLARRAGFSSQFGKDNLINACFSLLLGVLFLLAPLDVVSAVGFFGAYLVLSAVHLGIASFTPSKEA